MARAGARAGKVFSSGRPSIPVRAATCKKRAAVRKTSTTSGDSGYSLCSSDSEDQVLDINRGLDRCAALLHDILQCDVKERPLKPHKMSSTRGNVRSSTVRTKKTVVRKPPPASHVYKEKGPLRRTWPPGLCNAEVQRPGGSLDHVAPQMQRLNRASAPVPHSAPPAPGPETSALYNCRLPTSTPTLSPQHPADPQSSGNQDFHQTLPPGGASHFPSCRPAPSMAGSIQASAVPGGHQANILSQIDSYRSLIRDSDLLQCMAAHLAQLQQVPLQNQPAAYTAESVREEPPTESDSGDEDAAAAAPLREVSCQTSCNKSPEKTEKKIKTVKYLLEEIKSLVADQGDQDAVRLVTELERSVSLPIAASSTNVHAEVALALQPLRSENAQLRRRLRILNQQLRDRERAARTDEQISEVTALQSMNETLQHQLNESQKGREGLQSKIEELRRVIAAQEEENRKTARILQEREQEILHRDVTAADLKKGVDEAVGRMKSVQFKLEASEKENQILGITLRQRDAEVTRLRELTRTLQAGMAKLLCDLGKDAPKSKPGSSLTQAALGSYDRQVQDDQCPASTSIMNYLRRLETDQVFTGTDSMYSETPLLPSSGNGRDDYMVSKSHVGPPVPPYSPRRAKQELGSESCSVMSEGHRADETLYLPLASSPCKGRYDSSLRRMCTPPKVCAAEIDLDPRSQYNNHNGRSSSGQNPGVHKDSQSTPRTSAPTSKAHPEDSSLEVPPPRIPPPLLQQTRSLAVRGDRSVFEGRPDWTICSFSTFTSHDEQDFRSGLAALDANIAQLQRTLQNGSARK